MMKREKTEGTCESEGGFSDPELAMFLLVTCVLIAVLILSFVLWMLMFAVSV